MVTRRNFLRGSLLGAAGTSLFSSNVLAAVEQAAGSSLAPNTQGKLLLIFLRGGNDALNTVIPTMDPDYDVFRTGDGAIPVADRIPIRGASYAQLNKALELLAPIDDNGHIAWLHRVGDSKGTRSHFTAMDRLETAAEDGVGLANLANREGFVGAIVEKALGGALDAAGCPTASGFSPIQMRMFRTADEARLSAHVPTLLPAGLALPASATDAALEPLLYDHATFHGSQSPLGSLDAVVGNNMAFGLQVRSCFNSLQFAPNFCNTGRFPTDETIFSQCPGWPTPQFDPIGGQFMRHAEEAVFALKNVPGLRFAAVDFGGWDTHGDQKADHEKRLRYLGWGLRDIYDELFAGGGSPDTTVLVVSEFGRTIRLNSGMSTDHGVGGLYIAMGPKVIGGTYNIWDNLPSSREFGAIWPGLASMDASFGNALDAQTGWRDVLAHVLEKVFGVQQPSTIIPNYTGAGPGYLTFLV